MIRRATSKDIPAILEIGKKIHAQLDWAPPIDEQGCKMLLARALCDKQMLLLVGERNGEINGFFFGLAEEAFYSKAKYATDIVWCSLDAMHSVAMLRRFIAWAKERKVYMIDLSITSGMDVERTSALLEKLGFKRVGAHFIMRLA